MSKEPKITLYSTGCPKCEVLKKKLDAASINYTVNNNVDEMLSKNINAVPVLEVDGELLEFSAAVAWVNNEVNG